MVESSTYHSVSLISPSYRGMILATRKNYIPREILAGIVIGFFLVTPAFVSGSAKGILSIAPSVASTPTPHRSEIPSLFEVIRVNRGGGIGKGMKKNRNGSLYLKALDDEILWMEQQLRRVEQEKRSLKKKLSNRQQVGEDVMESKSKSKQRRGIGKNSLEKREEDLLRLANLEQLEKQKDSLITAKAKLESIKLDYDQKLQALQLDLSKSKSRNANLEKTFLARMKQLEASLKKVREAAANTNINSHPELSRKINEACQVAIAEFWMEGNRKLQEHEQQLKAHHERELMEERRLASLAVDRQRQKMRALARATAIREKEIAAKTKLISRQQTQTTSTSSRNFRRKSDEKVEREKIKSLREEAERKAKEEEQRMWLELERELEQERERLQRMKQREEEEKRRCEQEEMERRRLLQQHALDLEERLRMEQQQANTGDLDGSSGPSFFGKIFGSRKKNYIMSQPTIISIENYQRRVMWQPISLPPKEAVRITGPSKND